MDSKVVAISMAIWRCYFNVKFIYPDIGGEVRKDTTNT